MVRLFFPLTWFMQLSVGIALFLLSCWIEIQVFQFFFPDSGWLAVILAVALEVGKALAIIWNRYLQLGGVA